MAKTKIKNEKYGMLTREQAALVWAAKPNVRRVVKMGDKPRENLTSTSILSAPEMWPSWVEFLLMKGEGTELELDFEELANYFNEIIKTASAGMTPEPKALMGNDVRKLALDLTRARLADAKVVLATKPTDAVAQAKHKEAGDILASYGWAAVAVKRERIAKKAGKAPKTTPVTEPVTPDAKLVQAPKAPVEKGNNPPLEFASAPKPGMAETNRYYVTGNTKPVKEDLKKVGGQYDPNKTQWWFSNVEAQTQVQKIVDDYQAENK